MKKRLTVAAIAVLLIAFPAVTSPDYTEHRDYYDLSPSIVGYDNVYCGSPYFTHSGSTTEYFVDWIGSSCTWDPVPSCTDLALTQLSGCGPTVCVSDDYRIEYENGHLPNPCS